VPVRFQDYYKTLGVEKNASAAELSKAYRKLARKFHPDVSKSKDAEERFKEINEAYEVLKDPEKRKRYDMLGSEFHDGQEFRPPPGWEQAFAGFGARGPRPRRGAAGGLGGFSDFFEMLFGGSANFNAGPGQSFSFEDLLRAQGGQSGARAAGARAAAPQAEAQEVEIPFSLEEVYHGGTKNVQLQFMQNGSAPDIRTYNLRIPTGAREGGIIRLAGKGPNNTDLRLKVKLAPHPRYRADGHDLYTALEVSPWEAALGGKITMDTLDGPVQLTLKPGTQSGQQMRLRGKGLKRPSGERADLLAEIKIVIPSQLTDEERSLLEKLREISRFNPRSS
jgi:curved DNA-binding protein